MEDFWGVKKEKKLGKVLRDTAWSMQETADVDVWKPLEENIPKKYHDGFMFMQRSIAEVWKDGRWSEKELYFYKHGITRNYLHISKDGNFYCYDNGRYIWCSKEYALEKVFMDIKKLGATRETPYGERYRRERDEALAEAGYITFTASPSGITKTKKGYRIKEEL